jgi:hypothetical protein
MTPVAVMGESAVGVGIGIDVDVDVAMERKWKKEDGE